MHFVNRLKTRLVAPALLAVLAVAGCDPDEGFEADDVTDRGGVGSTIKFNTGIFEGVDELDTTGAIWKGVRLKAVYLGCPEVGPTAFRKAPLCTKSNPIKLDKVWSEKGHLRGSVGTFPYSDTHFRDSEWHIEVYTNGQLSNTHKLVLRDLDPVEGTYWFNFNGYLQVCQGDGSAADHSNVASGGAARALGNITVNTTTGVIGARPNTIYLACQSGAIGKAAKWGYRPWEIGNAKFTTAVRVIRADYCGDGVSWTKTGTEFQLEDIWDHSNFKDAIGADEAVWNNQGARCLSSRRFAADPVAPVLCTSVPATDDQPAVKAPLPDCHDTNVFPTFPGGEFWTKLPVTP